MNSPSLPRPRQTTTTGRLISRMTTCSTSSVLLHVPSYSPGFNQARSPRARTLPAMWKVPPSTQSWSGTRTQPLQTRSWLTTMRPQGSPAGSMMRAEGWVEQSPLSTCHASAGVTVKALAMRASTLEAMISFFILRTPGAAARRRTGSSGRGSPMVRLAWRLRWVVPMVYSRSTPWTSTTNRSGRHRSPPGVDCCPPRWPVDLLLRLRTVSRRGTPASRGSPARSAHAARSGARDGHDTSAPHRRRRW